MRSIFLSLSIMLGLWGIIEAASAAFLTVDVTNVTAISSSGAMGCVRDGSGWPKFSYCTSRVSGTAQTVSYTHREDSKKTMLFTFTLAPTDGSSGKFALSSRCSSLGVKTGSEANGYFATYEIDISNIQDAWMKFWYNSADNSSNGGTIQS